MNATTIDVGVAQQRRPSSITSSSSETDTLDSPTAVYPPDPTLYLGHDRSLAGIAVRAGGLGAAFTVGVLLASLAALLPMFWPADGDDNGLVAFFSPFWRLPFFLATLSAFHFLEFYTTAAYNTPAATVDSFLLTANWPAYAIAHAAGFIECFVRYTVFRESHGLFSTVWPTRTCLVLGFVAVAAGQIVRSAAMVQAGRSFNHQVQQRRARSHALVTTGIYAYLRHPSYFGFFWWAVGTQLVLGNVVCLAGYAAVLWRFFSMRIRREEQLLVRFFGSEYETYRRRVGTKMPFI